MRNLKKVLAVVLAVSMMLSTFTVAFAASSDSAENLNELGLLSNITDAELSATLNRAVGVAMILKSLGYTQADADANDEDAFTDLTGDYAWAAGFANLAASLEITNGVSETEFDPAGALTKKQLVTFQLRALGYEDAWENAAELAVEAGLIDSEDDIDDASFTKADAADVMFAALSADLQNEEGTLLDKLIADGVVDVEDAISVGLVADELSVVSVKAVNLKQIEVKLSNTDYDKDELQKEANYEFEGAVNDNDTDITISDASVDGTTLTLTLAQAVDNQTEGTLVIDKDVIGEELEYEDVEFFDVTLPEILDVQVVGEDTVKFTFSEPVNFEESGSPALAASKYEDEFDVELDSKSFSVDEIEVLGNGKEANVKVYGKFTEGTLTIEVDNGLEDYAGLNVIKETFELDVVEDNDAPEVVSYKDAKVDEITLVFNEDIVIADSDQENYYHTNDDDYVDANLTSSDVDGNELTLNFTTNNLPKGTAYIYIKADSVKDLWGNKNENTIKIKVEIDIDEVAPEVEDVEVKLDEIKITFNEELDEDSAEDTDNYVVTDEDGDEVDIRTATLVANDDGDKLIVKLDPKEDLDDGDYTVEIADVEDEAGNAMDDFEGTYTLEDSSAPGFPTSALLKVVDASAPYEYEITIRFDEEMAVTGAYSMLDLDKYEVTGVGNLFEAEDDDDDGFDVDIDSIDGNKGVKITIESDSVVIDTTDDITIGRLEDVAGNRTAYETTLNITMLSAASISVDEVKATAKDTLKVKFTGDVDKYDVDDFAVGTGIAYDANNDATVTNELEIKTIDVKDGDEIYITLKDKLPTNTDGYQLFTLQNTVDDSFAISTENSFGIKLAQATASTLIDEIAPQVLEDDNVDTTDVFGTAGNDDDIARVYATVYTDATTTTRSVITIELSEDVEDTSVTKGTFEVNGGDSTVLAIAENSGVITILVDEEVIKGDDVDQLAAIFDTYAKGNYVTDLALEIEYVVSTQVVADVTTVTP